MEHICSIAGLALEEAGGVAHAYLTTPTLVGRDEPLSLVRERLLAAFRETGSAVVIAAPGGGGRSRLLDACVLDAKLLGFQVVRLDRSDAGPRSVRRRDGVVPPVVRARASDRARCGPTPRAGVGARHRSRARRRRAGRARSRALANCLATLRDFVLSTARSLRLMVAVDDADQIDEASASLLSTLAQKLRRRALCIVLSVDSERESSAALEVLSELAERVVLAPLSEPQTEQLLMAVFGAANNLVTVAHRVQAIARGNPRAIMQLVTHLVDEGIARYEIAGAFDLAGAAARVGLTSVAVGCIVQTPRGARSRRARARAGARAHRSRRAAV